MTINRETRKRITDQILDAMNSKEETTSSAICKLIISKYENSKRYDLSASRVAEILIMLRKEGKVSYRKKYAHGSVFGMWKLV